MMTALRIGNRAMFWRIVRRLLGANRGRLFVILLALGAGAAVTAALLNLQVDAKRRITTELRVFGANVIIGPRDGSQPQGANQTIEESVLRRAEMIDSSQLLASGFLYAVINVAVGHTREPAMNSSWAPAVIAGYSNEKFLSLLPSRPIELTEPTGWDMPNCFVGSAVATRLHIHAGDSLTISTVTKYEEPDPTIESQCYVQAIESFGSAEDNQIFINAEVVQRLMQLPGRFSVVEMSVPGTPRQIDAYVLELKQAIPDADVHPLRQFTEGEAKIYNRISGLLTATVVIVLLLTGLCVMAAMTNVAMERKNDVGLMKAIGGATRRVLRLFMMEAALLGLTGGVIGAAAGIFLSVWLGKQVFGVAAQPRLIVYPVSVALTTLVAILSAYPLRRLASVRPASVFRGES
jgi:ABC-type lipoprotein release transport system permease subunit